MCLCQCDLMPGPRGLVRSGEVMWNRRGEWVGRGWGGVEGPNGRLSKSDVFLSVSGEGNRSPRIFFFFFLLDQGPFRGATDCPYYGLCVTLPMGFKVRVVLSPTHLLACMCVVNIRVMSAVTHACPFHQKGWTFRNVRIKCSTDEC